MEVLLVEECTYCCTLEVLDQADSACTGPSACWRRTHSGLPTVLALELVLELVPELVPEPLELAVCSQPRPAVVAARQEPVTL